MSNSLPKDMQRQHHEKVVELFVPPECEAHAKRHGAKRTKDKMAWFAKGDFSPELYAYLVPRDDEQAAIGRTPICEKCEVLMIQRRRDSDKRPFWGCPNFSKRTCNATKPWDRHPINNYSTAFSPLNGLSKLPPGQTSSGEVIQLFRYAMTSFASPDEAWRWLNKGNAQFQGMQPIEMLINVETYEQVLDAIYWLSADS